MTDKILTETEAAAQLRISPAQLRRIDDRLQPVWPSRPGASSGKGKRYLQARIDGYIDTLAESSRGSQPKPAYPHRQEAAKELQRRLEKKGAGGETQRRSIPNPK